MDVFERKRVVGREKVVFVQCRSARSDKAHSAFQVLFNKRLFVFRLVVNFVGKRGNIIDVSRFAAESDGKRRVETRQDFHCARRKFFGAVHGVKKRKFHNDVRAGIYRPLCADMLIFHHYVAALRKIPA